MTPPKAKFVDELYDNNEIHHMVSEFQEKDYTIFPKVLKRESVKEFIAQLERIMYFNYPSKVSLVFNFERPFVPLML